MDDSAERPQFAWQPLTARGLAAFAHASLSRVLVVQLAVALLVAGTVAWFLHGTWFATVSRAISCLPETGEIRGRRLDWRGESPLTLAEGRYLALTVDLKHEGQARSPAHVQVEFGENTFKVLSLLGYLEGKYPNGWVVAFNRTALQPWWGAWAPALLALAAAAVVLGLMLSWSLLATLYSLAAWLLAFLCDRDLGWRESWRLSGAALMPGALFMSGAIILYGLGALDLVRLAVALALHMVIGWVYLLAGTLRLPGHPSAAAGKPNPFRH